jgi:hypothetical protein
MTDLSDSFFKAIDEFDKLPPKEKARKMQEAADLETKEFNERMQEAGKKIFGQPPKKTD